MRIESSASALGRLPHVVCRRRQQVSILVPTFNKDTA